MSEEANPFADLVQHALDQDYNNANKIFGDLMSARVNDALDQEKIRLADQIYNGAELSDDDEDDIMGDEDDDQLELELPAEDDDEEQEDQEEDEDDEDTDDDEET